MIKRCTCGHELAPENGADPIGEISHGTCGRCYAIYTGGKAPYWYSVRIGGFKVELRIQPGHGQPHVSYDSPRKWDMPSPPKVIEQRVSHDGVQLDPAEFRDLLTLACERANVPSPGGHMSRPAFSHQPLLPFAGHLERAFARTGYGEEGAS